MGNDWYAMRNIHNFAPAFWGLWRHCGIWWRHLLNSRVLFRPGIGDAYFHYVCTAFMHYTNGDGFGATHTQ